MSQFDEPPYEAQQRHGEALQPRPVQGVMPGKCPACGREGTCECVRTDVMGIAIAYECRVCGAVM